MRPFCVTRNDLTRHAACLLTPATREERVESEEASLRRKRRRVPEAAVVLGEPARRGRGGSGIEGSAGVPHERELFGELGVGSPLLARGRAGNVRRKSCFGL